MSKWKKTLDRILRGTSDANIGFNDLCDLLRRMGFAERVRGDHHIFTREGVVEILNLQPKGDQVRQVRNVIVDYGLVEEANGDA